MYGLRLLLLLQQKLEQRATSQRLLAHLLALQVVSYGETLTLLRIDLRDGVGRIVDAFLDPITWVGYSSVSAGTKVAVAATAFGIKAVHTRAGLLQAIDAAKESSVDYYLFAQGAYYQYRQGVLTDGKDDEDIESESTPETGELSVGDKQ